MIKFFRHIRQRLIGENRFSKYLLYAIGEIILVVIGILIALQINNWNENRKERILENSILDKISTNIQDDINQYNKILSAENSARVKVDSFLTIIRNPMRFQTSDLDPYYKSLWYFQRFTPNKSALTNLISSGKINIIENQELLENVLGYYKTIDEQTASVDEALASYSRNEIGPYIMKFDFMDSNAINSEYRKRKSLLEYHQEPAIENLAYARIQLMNTQRAYYLRQINNAKTLLEMINLELKKQ
ncbi:MAG: DUF6090 family protein [Altibacter sp.]|nr:DUF6090 family protein [Altibacter sp.]